jgi:RNase P/RNase MRP subunit POP5
LLKRQKRRYIAVHILSSSVVDREEFLVAVWRAVEKLYGEYGASKTGLALITFDGERKVAILRCVNSGLEIARAAIASVTRISDASASLRVLRVSGTIRSIHDKTVV